MRFPQCTSEDIGELLLRHLPLVKRLGQISETDGYLTQKWLEWDFHDSNLKLLREGVACADAISGTHPATHQVGGANGVAPSERKGTLGAGSPASDNRCHPAMP
jgi:hypothetical protein